MTGRAVTMAGGVVATIALLGLGFYLVTTGLDEADKLASVLSLFVGLAGLAVATYGLVAQRTGPGSGNGDGIASTGENATNIQMKAEASGHGRVFMAGGDQTINE